MITTRGLNNVISVSQSGKVSRVHPGKPDHKLQIPGFLVAPFPYISPDVGPPLGTGKPPSHAYTAMYRARAADDTGTNTILVVSCFGINMHGQVKATHGIQGGAMNIPFQMRMIANLRQCLQTLP